MSIRLTFTRSGGLVAAPGLRVQASATLTGDGGDVVSSDGYCRRIGSDEAARLMADCDAVSAQWLRLKSHSSPSADAFVFALTIASEGRHVEIDSRRIGESPEQVRIIAWVSAEADLIFQHRTQAKP